MSDLSDLTNYKQYLPKYVHIYEWLLQQIQSKKIQVGDKLPTEQELMERFHVNRVTIRSAIAKLQKANMVVRRRGKGTFLIADSPPKFVRSLQTVYSVSDDQVGEGTTVYKTLHREEITAPQKIASMLNLTLTDEILVFTRVASSEGDPVVIEKTHLIPRLANCLKGMDLDTPYYVLLEKHCDTTPTRMTVSLKPVLPNEYEQEHLQIDAHHPCLAVESVLYDQRGEAVEVIQSVYRGDKYVFTGESDVRPLAIQQR